MQPLAARQGTGVIGMTRIIEMLVHDFDEVRGVGITRLVLPARAMRRGVLQGSSGDALPLLRPLRSIEPGRDAEQE